MTEGLLNYIQPSKLLSGSWTNSASVLVVSTLVFLATYIVYRLLQFHGHLRHLEKVFKNTPGPTERHWLYGNIHSFPVKSSERIKHILAIGDKFRRYFRIWMGPGMVTLVVNHPTTAKAVMKTSEPKPTGFGGMYRFGMPWLGQGLLMSSGARWARSRRLLTPAFHFDILKPYVAVYNDAAERMMLNLDKFAQEGRRFEIFTHASRITLDVILRCAFSYETDCQKDGPAHPYLVAVNDLANTWWAREKKLHLYFDWVFYLTSAGKRFKKNCDYVHKVAEDVIRSRQKALASSSSATSGRKYLDFLDILLTAKDDSGNSMSLLDIRNEVDTFLFEGHDTTASSISWVLYSLAKHPECQRRAQEEIDDILDGREDDTVHWSDVSKLEYLYMCIKEGLRLYPAVPFIQREFTQDFQLEGRTFPKGTKVALHIMGLHHNDDVWENAEEFMPERFSKDKLSEMDSYQFVPFSAGPRNCIGQNFAQNEEKVILSRLLRRYNFTLDPSHIVEKKIAATLRTETGIMMFVTRRN